MIVVDASAAVSALFRVGAARDAFGQEQLHAPHPIDVEVASSIRRRVGIGALTAIEGWRVVDTWRRLGVVRYPSVALLERVWELRDDLSFYDACYVALAEALHCALWTADSRLSRAPGLRCPVTVVPR